MTPSLVITKTIGFRAKTSLQRVEHDRIEPSASTVQKLRSTKTELMPQASYKGMRGEIVLVGACS